MPRGMLSKVNSHDLWHSVVWPNSRKHSLAVAEPNHYWNEWKKQKVHLTVGRKGEEGNTMDWNWSVMKRENIFWVWEGYLVEVKCYSDCGVIYRRMCSTRVNILSRFGNSKFQVSLKDKQKSNVQNQIIQFFKQWVIYKSVKHFPSALRTRFFFFIIMCSK